MLSLIILSDLYTIKTDRVKKINQASLVLFYFKNMFYCMIKKLNMTSIYHNIFHGIITVVTTMINKRIQHQ